MANFDGPYQRIQFIPVLSDRILKEAVRIEFENRSPDLYWQIEAYKRAFDEQLEAAKTKYNEWSDALKKKLAKTVDDCEKKLADNERCVILMTTEAEQRVEDAEKAKHAAYARVSEMKEMIEKLTNPSFHTMSDKQLEDAKSVYNKHIKNIELEQTKREAQTSAFACGVCYERPKNTAFQCGHIYCLQCADQVVECPACRTTIEMRLEVFL